MSHQAAPEGYTLHESIDLGGHVANVDGSGAMYDTLVNLFNEERVLIPTRRKRIVTPSANPDATGAGVRWVPSNGSLDHFFDDELVPASRGVQEQMLRKIEPFPTKRALLLYNPGYSYGWVVERYQLDLVSAAKEARDGNGRRDAAPLRRRGARRHASKSSGEKRLLRPDLQARPCVRSATYASNHGARNFQVVLNGSSSGAFAGKYPKSWIKITLAVLAGLATGRNRAAPGTALNLQILPQERPQRRLCFCQQEVAGRS